MTNIAILGFGVVGSGIFEIVKQNEELLSKSLGGIKVKKILDVRDFDSHEYAELFTKNFEDILNDSEISIVCEVIGGVGAAFEFTKRCLAAGKSVVTSNKELVAKKGTYLVQLAKENNVHYMFEASVGGGIPVLRQINQICDYTEITKVAGILNGTTNYILTKMFEEGEKFEDALAGAQKNGYAERDPSADVNGIDAARKLTILMSMITGKAFSPDDVYVEGISKISREDVILAEKAGMSIKLVGYGVNEKSNTFARVTPLMISEGHPLSSVKDVFNAVLVHDDMTDDVIFYGRGAGMLPTAAAVVSDVADIIKSANESQKFVWTDEKNEDVIDFKDSVSSFFVRVKGCEKDVEKVFGKVYYIDDHFAGETAFFTDEMKESEIQEKTKKLNETCKTVSIIRRFK